MEDLSLLTTIPLELFAGGILSYLSAESLEVLREALPTLNIDKALVYREYWHAKLENLLGIRIQDQLVGENIEEVYKVLEKEKSINNIFWKAKKLGYTFVTKLLLADKRVDPLGNDKSAELRRIMSSLSDETLDILRKVSRLR